jgi:hypothetical protein
MSSILVNFILQPSSLASSWFILLACLARRLYNNVLCHQTPRVVRNGLNMTNYKDATRTTRMTSWRRWYIFLLQKLLWLVQKSCRLSLIGACISPQFPCVAVKNQPSNPVCSDLCKCCSRTTGWFLWPAVIEMANYQKFFNVNNCLLSSNSPILHKYACVYVCQIPFQ